MPTSAPNSETDADRFVLMTCQRSAEAALKHEMARCGQKLRLAFSRPGFLTFKWHDAPESASTILPFRSCFARWQALSAGCVRGATLEEMACAAWQLDEVKRLIEQDSLDDLHVWQREGLPPGEPELHPARSPLVMEVERVLRLLCPVKRLDRPPQEFPTATRGGATVLDVVVVEPNEWWIGWHQANTRQGRWPGGVIAVRVPEEAISRAYGKMEEALRWSRLPLARGDYCAEIGCAPGGASQALLERGAKVLGIDPAEVNPALLDHPRFRHIRKRGADVRRREFREVQWLVADMNVAPAYTLDTVEDIVMHPQVHIRGLVLTLKLLDWSLADELDSFVERVQSWGYRDVRARQLVRGGQEVCLVAMRSRGQRRLARAARRVTGKSDQRRPPAGAVDPSGEPNRG